MESLPRSLTIHVPPNLGHGNNSRIMSLARHSYTEVRKIFDLVHR